MNLLEYSELEVKKGIKLHLIKTELFKTNLACVLITKYINSFFIKKRNSKFENTVRNK